MDNWKIIFKIMKDRKGVIVLNKASELLFIMMFVHGWHVGVHCVAWRLFIPFSSRWHIVFTLAE